MSSVMADARLRLERRRRVTPLVDTRTAAYPHGRTYGSGAQLDMLLSYWQHDYDWDTSPTVLRLRSLPQFVTTLHGLRVHFIHRRAVRTDDAQPRRAMLLLHGWPGSVLEFLDAIPHLSHGVDSRNAYDIVVPSLPGFGFSDAPTRAGCNVHAIAHMMLELMSRLGYDAEGYIVQGGDWGSMIATAMAQIQGSRSADTSAKGVLGIHINMLNSLSPWTPVYALLADALPASLRWLIMSDEEYGRAGLPAAALLGRIVDATGYMHQQATRPDVLAAGLHDSPAGLAAWMLHAFEEWSDASDGSTVTQRFSSDWLVTNIMMYWGTGNVASSLRLYRESLADAALWTSLRTAVVLPAAVADYPAEVVRNTQRAAQYQFHTLLQFVTHPRGGHFAAKEQPQLVAQDVRSAAKLILSHHAQQ